MRYSSILIVPKASGAMELVFAEPKIQNIYRLSKESEACFNM